MTPKERAVMQQALKAMKDASPYGLTFKEAIIACEEALYHSGEANEMVGCAYCNNPLFAGTKCNNCGFITLAEQAEPNSTFMEGYRIGLAEMREKCAKVCDDIGDSDNGYGCAAAIRTIKFEGDTGFRPVSEMIAEHKQDPKKAAAIEKANMRKATRAEKIAMSGVYEVPVEQAEQEPVAEVVLRSHKVGFGRTEERKDIVFLADVEVGTKLYAAPVRTKDLTDEEIYDIGDSLNKYLTTFFCDFARAVIAADREKNK